MGLLRGGGRPQKTMVYPTGRATRVTGQKTYQSLRLLPLAAEIIELTVQAYLQREVCHDGSHWPFRDGSTFGRECSNGADPAFGRRSGPPDGAVYALEVTQPAKLLDFAEHFEIPEMLLGKPVDPGFRTLIDTLGKRAGADFNGLIRQFTGGGITYAVYPGENSVWIFDAQNAAVLDALQQFVKAIAGAHAVAPASTKQPAMFYQEYPGNVVAWSLDGKQCFARTGNRLILAANGELLKALFAPRTHGNLAGSALYTEAKRAAGSDSAAWAFVNMAMLNQYPPAKKSLAGGDLFDLIFNGAVKQSLRGSTWLAMGLDIDGKRVRLHAVDNGRVDKTGAGAFTLPGEAGLLPNLNVPRELAAVTLWRDLGQFYSQKETLFPEKTSGGILAENFLEIFFTGRDLNQEVFSKFSPQVRLVVAPQHYDAAAGTPVEQYPAVALVFRVAHNAEDFGEVLEEAWQKAVGLTNFTRGQSAEPGVLLDREDYGGVRFTYGAFSVRGEKDRAHLPARFNFRPAIVRDGPYIILSSTDGLAKDLIDAVNHEDARTRGKSGARDPAGKSSARNPAGKSGAHTVVEVNSPAEIAALLKVNRAAMIRQSVLSSGKKPEQAALEFDSNTAWLGKLDHARLTISATVQGQQTGRDKKSADAGETACATLRSPPVVVAGQTLSSANTACSRPFFTTADLELDFK